MINSMPNQLSIVFVGAGNLATHLAQAMHQKGFNIQQVYSRTLSAAQLLADFVGADFTDSIEQINTNADLYITALTDEALLQLVPQLTSEREKGLWIHTAGSVPISVWEGHCLHFGVFYPLQTFSKKRAVDFSNIPLFIEGSSSKETECLLEIAKELTTEVYQASSEQRKSLHLAAVFASNFTNHMYASAASLLEEYDLPFKALLPLIEETAKKVHFLAPGEAQTGPAIRNDKKVMEEHLEMLTPYPSLHHLYMEISDSIVNIKK